MDSRGPLGESFSLGAEEGSRLQPCFTCRAQLQELRAGAKVTRGKGRVCLLVLTADAVQLYASGGGQQQAAGGGARAALLGSPAAAFCKAATASRQVRKLGSAALGRLGRHSGSEPGRLDEMAGAGEEPAGPAAPEEGGDSSEEEDMQDEDTVFTWGCALSQVIGIHPGHDGSTVVVEFHPNTASRKKMASAALRGLAFPIGYPISAVRHKQASVRGYLTGDYPSDADAGGLQHSCVIRLGSQPEAAQLQGAIEAAMQRLAAAVRWLQNDLPLNETISALAITVAAPEDEGRGELLAMEPAWGQRVGVPEKWSRLLSGGGPAAIQVWLHTPLGPARAAVGPAELSACGKSCPITLEAHLLKGYEQQPACPSRGKLRVQLQCSAASEPAPAATHAAPPTTQPTAQQRLGWSALSEPMKARLAGTLALVVVVIAAWAQLYIRPGSTAVEILRIVAFMVAVLATCATLSFFLAVLRPETPWTAEQAQAPQAAEHYRRWWLTLLRSELVERRPDLLLPQTLEAAGVEVEEKPPAGLPASIRSLLQQYPECLDEDTAARFLDFYKAEHRAFAALQEAAEWRIAEGAADLLRRPQPKFDLIKGTFPHGAYGWSRIRDCVVDIQCHGVWSAAYQSMRAAGVTDRELLHHLLFCMDYNAKMNDPRPLPHGKTLTIVDLSGLSMSDATGEAFGFIRRAGQAMDTLHPRRLEQAFLVNAPGWWSLVWRLVAPMISKKTRDKFQVFGRKDYAAMQAALLQAVDADQLPEAYGGSARHALLESEWERRMREYVASLS